MQIVVVGPGALGCLFASILLKGNTESGDSITILDYHEDRANLVSKNGIFYQQGQTTTNYSARVVSDPSLLGIVDAIFLCVKSYDVENTLTFCAPLLGENTLLIFMQNGMAHLQHSASLDTALPLFGTTTEGATYLGPGSVRHAGEGTTYLGFLQPQLDRHNISLKKVISRLTAGGLEISGSTSIYSRLWAKLFINVGINSLTAIYNCKNGELLNIPKAKELMAQAIAEAQEVARAEGVTISNPLKKTLQICRSTADNVSSMLQDVRQQRKTEIDAINGAITQMASKYNIATPVNSFLVDRVKEIENNSRKK